VGWYRTSPSLNDNLRLARLTLPQWGAIVVGGVVVWADAILAAGVHNPNLHLMVICLPAVLVVAPILALFRGGIERYPHQALRYAWRQARTHTSTAIRYATVYTREGVRYARVHAAQRRQR